MKKVVIRNETPADFDYVENLTREAFWNVYKPGCDEHYALHCLRNDKDFIRELDFVLEKDGIIIGHIMYMKAYIDADDGTKVEIMTFGPISIAPDYKRKGYGKRLLDFSLKKAASLGCGCICIEGNIDFYGKSGFVLAGTKGIRYHGEPNKEIVPYFLLKELKKGFLNGIKGIYHTPQGYFVDKNKVEKFDKNFPKKEKLKLPGQIFE